MSQPQIAAPVTPLPAASILLLRDGPDGLEVLMMERHAAMGFAAGAMVFPGGKIDASDEAPALIARGNHSGNLSGSLDLSAFRLGALRELFEEAGILLGVDAEGEAVDPTRAAELAALHREDVLGNPPAFAAMLGTEDLYLAAGDLVHFAHWITPQPVPRRFDTHFFVTRAPAGQGAVSDGQEAVSMSWLRPAVALEMAVSGEHMLMFPTKLNLGRLARSCTVDEALTVAASSPVVTVMPTPIVEDGEIYLTIPPEAGYGEVKIRRADIPEAAGGNPGRPGKGAKQG